MLVCFKLSQRQPILYHKLLSQQVHVWIQIKKLAEFILHHFFPPSYKANQEESHKNPENKKYIYILS